MSELPKCPECGSEYTYEDREMFVCPECAHEWSMNAVDESADDAKVIKDANGNVLRTTQTNADGYYEWKKDGDRKIP